MNTQTEAVSGDIAILTAAFAVLRNKYRSFGTDLEEVQKLVKEAEQAEVRVLAALQSKGQP